VSGASPEDEGRTTVEHLLRDLAPQVLAAVARRHDDFAAAEDAVQEALIAAATRWPTDGVPANPRGWLYHVALRRITDHLRSELARRRREEQVASEVVAEWAFVPDSDADAAPDQDDALALIFMCCHPALTPPSAIALTLRAIGGLTTAEIASAFLVPETTMAQRISRAKQTIKASRVPFSMPRDTERIDRLGAVLQILYLIFNEGYTSTAGSQLNRPDLSNEAIRLARMLRQLLPHEPEVAGLLALMLLTDARRPARTGDAGELVPLDEQDRARWNRELIAEGTALLAETLSGTSVGPYQIQAAIAAVHDEAASFAETDWPQILALYQTLGRASDNPMIGLNQAVAAAMVHGPGAALDQLDALERDERIAGHYRLDVVRGHLFEMAGDRERAVRHYRAAAERTASIPARNYLLGKAARIASWQPADASPVGELGAPRA
jgi:RNA polymerase sigma factor (sigma-70 family)